MKVVTHLVIIVVAVGLLTCSDKKNEDSGKGDSNAWPEMHAFHKVMADVYHPYMDSVNLEPLKHQSEALASEASKWAAAPIPKSSDNEEMKELLGKLETDSRTLADLVKGGASDEELGKALTGVHEEFHVIMERRHEHTQSEKHK